MTDSPIFLKELKSDTNLLYADRKGKPYPYWTPSIRTIVNILGDQWFNGCGLMYSYAKNMTESAHLEQLS
jgi:hypothetical protein